MIRLGGVELQTPSPSRSDLPRALRALRGRLSTVLPGVYAWLTTVALPSVQHEARAGARLSAFFALLALLAAPLFIDERPRLGRALGIYSFVGCSLLTWALLGAGFVQSQGDPLLSALGAIAFTLYALGWGSLRRRDAVPEDAPNVIPGPPLRPRSRPQGSPPMVFGLISAAALVPICLAFRVVDPARALFGHAAATVGAIVSITVGARVAVSIGQRERLPPVAERLNAAAVPLALMALVFGLGFLWLVVR